MKIVDLFNVFSSLTLKKGKYLLAFSGGGDSVFLLISLSLFYKENLNKHIEIAYIDYHDSDEVQTEEKIVNFYVNKYNIILNKIDVICPINTNFEDWARKIRYDYFKKIINEKKLNGLLVAHQKDDLIETYIIQKNRKSLPLTYGLKTKTFNNDIIIYRPLLNITKEEIYLFLNNNNYPFYEDKTNQNMKHERNRIRHINISEKEKEALINELTLKNNEIVKLYNSFSKLNKRIDFLYYDKLNDEEKKRLIFYILKRDTKLSYLSIEGTSKNIFLFLEKKGNNILKLDEEFTICKTNSFFFITNLLDKEYTFYVDKPQIIETDFFKVDLNKISLNLIKGFPLIIRNYHKNDVFQTDIFEKNVELFLKKHGVPFFLKKIYPVFLYNNKVVYSPFYKDILNKKIPFSLPYLNE